MTKCKCKCKCKSGQQDSGSGSETLQTPDDRLLPIEVGGVWEFHWLVVSDPEPEQCNEDLIIETAGEGKQHECPRVDERIVAQVINLARLSMFRGPVCQAGKRWRLRKLRNK